MSKKDYLQQIKGAERRVFTSPVEIRMEKREDEEKEEKFHVIEGHAFVFNSRADLGWFKEEILPGAADDILNDDVRALFNHDPNYVLARSNKGEGTLELFVDEIGLGYRYTTPDRSFARDLQDMIERGDVSQSSFGFLVGEEKWIFAKEKGEKDIRQITKLSRLFDVSPVTFPAYQDTDVAKRSMQSYRKDGKSSTSEKNKDGRNSVSEEERVSTLDINEARYMFNLNNQ